MRSLGRFLTRTVIALMAVFLFAGLACSGAQQGGTAAQAPQAPQQAAQPAPAAPAAEPHPAQSPSYPVSAPAPRTQPVGPISVVEKPKYGGIATFAVRQEPTAGWDSTTFLWFETHQVGAPVWGSGNLVRACPEDSYKVCPGLAEKWENNKDFTEWTFKIRDNVLWHDGKPFTAGDAKAWVEFVTFGAKSGEKSRRPAWYDTIAGLSDLKKVEVLEGNWLRMTLAHPNPVFLGMLDAPFYTVAHPPHLIGPRIAAGEVAVTPLDVGVVGTGPFKFVKYEKGTRAEVRRFDKYWEKDAAGNQLPYLDGLDFALIRDPTAMDAAFRVGRLDGGSPGGGHTLTKERQAAYVRDLGSRVWFAEMPTTSMLSTGLGFNVLKTGPWQDVRVRRAISLWIDRASSIPVLAGSFGFMGPIMNPNNPYTSPDFATWPGWNQATREADRAEAKRLMAEAGYANGFSMTQNCATISVWLDRCQFLKAQLAGLGIELKLDLMDMAQWNTVQLTLQYDAPQVGGTPQTPLPEAMEGKLTTFSVSKNTVTKHEDRKVPEYFDRLKAATSVEQRVKVWREFERYWLVEQAYFVPLTQTIGVIPYRAHFKGRPVPREGVMHYLDFGAAWLDK